MMYWYASPVHIPSGAIGDIGCSLYTGEDRKVRAHLRNVWDTTMVIASKPRVGMSFAELYRLAAETFVSEGFENNIYSAHDGRSTNIGHTMPWSYESSTPDERQILASGMREHISDLVSRKRRFISATEQFEITEDTLFTIEPRLSRPGLPTASFHVVVGFVNGEPVVVTEFEPVFALFGMDDFR